MFCRCYSTDVKSFFNMKVLAEIIMAIAKKFINWILLSAENMLYHILTVSNNGKSCAKSSVIHLKQ